jgi:ATP-dependent helicase YprA (DUF1998 family)
MFGVSQPMTNLTEAIRGVQGRHFEFLEATYHIRHARLLEERERLLREGSVFRQPWLEATPTYERRQSLSELGLSGPVEAILNGFAGAQLGVYDPPYVHQAEALQSFFNDQKDLVVSTGTGSGKTEVFLYSILGLLAQEGVRHRTTSLRGIRALILYPMNALVADQLARIRKMLGAPAAAGELSSVFGRIVQFGMYTGRTPYHGLKDPEKDSRNLRAPMKFYLDLLSDSNRRAERDALQSRGRIPAKDIVGFAQKPRRIDRYWTQPGDRELLTRQEMLDPSNRLGGTPDLLITNYSMLQYMLLRPIEQRLFDDTRHWLASDPENKLLLVLDEAHLYRGAQGAEVALLIKRLLQRLGIGRDRLRCIITSASLGSGGNADVAGPRFGSQLAGGNPSDYRLITGTRRVYGVEAGPAASSIVDPLASLSGIVTLESVSAVGESAGWPPPADGEELSLYLGRCLPGTSEYRRLYNAIAGKPRPIGEVAAVLFPQTPVQIAEEATLNLMLIATIARDSSGQALTPSRIHLFSRGLFSQYACSNSQCPARRATSGSPLLGRLHNGPRDWCECGSRAFELFTHRTCGAAYLRAYRRRTGRTSYPVFLWASATNDEEFEEIHLLVEEPRRDVLPGDSESLFMRTAMLFLDPATGFLVEDNPRGDRLPVWLPQAAPADVEDPWTWRQCPSCGIEERLRDGRSKVSDLETKGEQPFASLVQAIFSIQSDSNPDPRLANHGRKVLCFSDSRQKAARLARDLQFAVQLDSLREMFVLSAHRLPPEFNLGQLFPQFVIECERHNISFFDDRDASLFSSGAGYSGSRRALLAARTALREKARMYGLASIDEAPTNFDVCRDLNELRPAQYGSLLLRHLGDVNYSLEATLVGFVRMRTTVADALAARLRGVPRGVLDDILYVVVHNALAKRAFDRSLTDHQRRDSRSSRPGRGWGPDDEGLEDDELIPSHLLPDIEILIGRPPSLDLQGLLKRTLSDAAPFSPKGTRWFLNPAALTLSIDFERTWSRCAGCHQFSAAGLAGKCPREGCGGRLEDVNPHDTHLRARRDLFRNPSRRVYEGAAPFTIRAEEHSAQLSTRDSDDVFSKAEEYELLFQDVLLDDEDGAQAVDVLSCTTTMEVGVDIGSLTAVALRTVPPRPDNYQQRSGRAGRRGSAISTILTYADNSPYESYVFDNPGVLIGADPSDPIIYINNPKIATRHVHASLLQEFFQRPLPGGAAAARFRVSPDLFASLGTLGEFFGPRTEYSFDAFREWLRGETGHPSQSTIRIGELLPDGLSAATAGSEWRAQFISEVALDFLDQLEQLRVRTAASPESGEANLLSTLLESSVLPTFSFPTSLCKFTVQEIDPVSRRVRTAFEPQADLMQALSQYVPGREIVMGKRTFVSYGISVDFAPDPVNHATGEPWGSLPVIGLCRGCGTVVRDESHPDAPLPLECPICAMPLASIPMYKPRGFAPEYIDSTLREDVDPSESKSRATSAKLPLPVAAAAAPPSLGHGWSAVRAVYLPDEPLVVVNLGGRGQEGYWICRLCGAMSTEAAVIVPHNRPYPRHPRVHVRSQCRGSSVQTALGYSFRTDLAVVRVPMDSTFDLTVYGETTPLNAAAISISEALGLAAARVLGIDSSELNGGYRVTPRGPGDDPTVVSNLDFFFYDTTPGGAGFSAAVVNRLPDVLESAREILSSCDCSASCQSCLRTYDNRFDHLRLDRFLALSLLEFMQTGRLPPVAPARQSTLLESLGRSVQLLGAFGPRLTYTVSATQVSLTKGTSSVQVELIPALAGGSQILQTPAGGGRATRISEFVVLQDLPRAATAVFDLFP